jgi:hypothetical protein
VCNPTHLVAGLYVVLGVRGGVLLAIYHKAGSLGAAFPHVKSHGGVPLARRKRHRNVCIASVQAVVQQRREAGNDMAEGRGQYSLQQTSSWLPCFVSAALVLAETILHGLLVRRRRHVPGHRAGVAAWVLARRILLRA